MKQPLAFPQLAKAANLQPKPDLTPDPSPEEMRSIFRERPDTIPQQPLKIARKHATPTVAHPLNMRVDLELFNRFVEYSKSIGRSYSKTLELLLDKANVPPDGKL